MKLHFAVDLGCVNGGRQFELGKIKASYGGKTEKVWIRRSKSTTL